MFTPLPLCQAPFCHAAIPRHDALLRAMPLAAAAYDVISIIDIFADADAADASYLRRVAAMPPRRLPPIDSCCCY